MGYCYPTRRIKKEDHALIKVSAKPETDEIELVYFFLPSETYMTHVLHIFNLIKTQDIRFVVFKYTCFILLDIDSNYFFSVDLRTHKIKEEKISSNIGYAPSLSLLGDEYILAVGGMNSNSINLYDLSIGIWIIGPKMMSPRYGAYVLYNEKTRCVYICGGKDTENDNTLEVEIFYLNNLQILETSVVDFDKSFAMRRSFPIVIQSSDYSSFLVCGGIALFDEEVETTTLVSTGEHKCDISVDLGVEISSKNPLVSQHGNYVYFFAKDDLIVKFNFSEITITTITLSNLGKE